MNTATKFAPSGVPGEPPSPVIHMLTHEADLRRRAAEHTAKRAELRKCLNPLYAAKLEAAKPQFRWSVKAKWANTSKVAQGGYHESEQEVVAQTENDAWSKFCDLLGAWPSRQNCDLVSIKKGKQVSADDVAAQMLNVDEAGEFPTEWIGPPRKSGKR